MDRPRTIRGLIFDFDGLVLETETAAFQSWQEIYAEHGCSLLLSDWAKALGGSGAEFDPCSHLEIALGRELDRDSLRARRRQRKLELVAAESLLPGVAGYLADGKRLGLKIGLASSSDRSWVVEHLTRHAILDQFDAMSCGADAQRVKPHPDLYQMTLAALELQPREAIALEDSPNGVWAAKRAGLFCVAVPNPLTCQLPLDHADLRLSSLEELPLKELLRYVEQRG